MKTKLPPGWRALAKNETIQPGDMVDYNPFSYWTGKRTRTPLGQRLEVAVVVAECQVGTSPLKWQKRLRAEDEPMFFRYGAPAVKGGEKACADLVALAREWDDPAVLLTERSPLRDEAHAAFMLDPSCLSEVPDGDQSSVVALYVLFYAAAKRCGDL